MPLLLEEPSLLPWQSGCERMTSTYPCPMGPPDKSQACAKVENELSIMERCLCGKLFPRNLIEPGLEEVSEDPRRRELYRLWVARNCHFIKN